MTQYEKMTQTPVGKLIAGLAIPTIISMLITNIYNLVDAFFVGQISTSASGAIGIVMGLQSIIQAFGFMFGHGAGSIISRKLGSKDSESATRLASTSFFSSFFVGCIILVVGLLCLNPLLRLFGSTVTILPYARSYGFFVLLAAPFMASSCVLNNIMRYEGRASLAMIGLSTGGVLNMIGDPILMFGLHMGMDGAGLSTMLSQMISFCILLFMFLSGKTQSKLSIRKMTKSWSEFILILQTGFPSLVRQGLNSVSTVVLNNYSGLYGDVAVAAMSIVNRIIMFIASIMIGIGQGLQPVAAYNYGAKKYNRVKEGFWFTLKSGEVVLTIAAIVSFIFAPQIVAVFRNDPGVIQIGATALRFQCVSMVLQPLGVVTNMGFQSVGESKKASFVAMLRTGLFFIPTIIFLSNTFGLVGIQTAQAVSDALSFIVVLPMLLNYIKTLPEDGQERVL